MLSCGVCGHCSGLGCKYGATLGQRIDLKRPSNFDLAWLSKRAKRGPRERVEHAVGCHGWQWLRIQKINLTSVTVREKGDKSNYCPGSVCLSSSTSRTGSVAPRTCHNWTYPLLSTNVESFADVIHWNQRLKAREKSCVPFLSFFVFPAATRAKCESPLLLNHHRKTTHREYHARNLSMHARD